MFVPLPMPFVLQRAASENGWRLKSPLGLRAANGKETALLEEGAETVEMECFSGLRDQAMASANLRSDPRTAADKVLQRAKESPDFMNDKRHLGGALHLLCGLDLGFSLMEALGVR
ncbi:hypothetical protein NDU88_011357 [Pleurodeles waltl]|uniref:Uncharacterized protein n=1 Tax=Pleurodeles waltl TaxID=8319 RepID=A0AAV7Q0E3_PLEWA|nr:hypothetical protein NDU88_011357 [Pleurodeles waltl]